MPRRWRCAGFRRPARRACAGLGEGRVLAANACEALLARGRTAEAAALIDPLITGPPDRDNWRMHVCRAEIDLLRGDIGGRRRAAAADQTL